MNPKEKAVKYFEDRINIGTTAHRWGLEAIDIAIKETEELALESTEWHLKERDTEIKEVIDKWVDDGYAACNDIPKLKKDLGLEQ